MREATLPGASDGYASLDDGELMERGEWAVGPGEFRAADVELDLDPHRQWERGGSLRGRLNDGWPEAAALARGANPLLDGRLAGRRIVVATDFSGTSDVAWKLGLRLSQRTGSLLHLVHVLDGFREIFSARNRRLALEPDAVLAEIQTALAARAVPALDRGVAVLSSSLVGAPGPELVRHAEQTRASLLLLPVSEDGAGPFGAGLGVKTLDYVLRHLPPSMVSVVTGPT